MERKIGDQNSLIGLLYDDLESKEKTIERLDECLKDAKDLNKRNVKKMETEIYRLEDQLEEKSKVIEDLRNNVPYKCSKGSDRYSKSVDDNYDAGLKHKSKLLKLKQIADDHKI